MTPEQAIFWLQGFAELHPEPPSAAQWQSIREHVASVFVKETPPLRFDLSDLRPRPEARRPSTERPRGERLIC